MTAVMLGALLIILGPIVLTFPDILPSVIARRRGVVLPSAAGPGYLDFEVLVPIWGNTRYLENEDFLSAYGSSVMLCTTCEESPEFNAELEQIASRRGFRIFRADVPRGGVASAGDKRAVSGTIRDPIMRQAAAAATAHYVVALDADTHAVDTLQHLVGAVDAAYLDVASVRIVPADGKRILGRLQRIEYRIAMRLRRLWPWFLSGACHVATADAYRAIMNRHSMFFQGNDAEVGILATKLGLRVGHVDFDVTTTVPEGFRAWFRQRFAWAGGEFRLGIVNVRLITEFPLFFVYLTGIVLLMLPLRWVAIAHLPLTVLVAYGVYVILVFASERRFTSLALVYPMYGLFSSLVLVALSPFSYVRMATTDHNAGIIRAHSNANPRHSSLTPTTEAS